MEPDLAQQRQEAHLLLDVLPEEKLFAVRALLNVLVEPLSKTLGMAPDEKEELTPEAVASIQRGSLNIERGEYTSHADMLREFGG